MRQVTIDERHQLPGPEYSNFPSKKEKEVGLRDYWKIILKRQWMIIAFFFIVLMTTAVVTFTTRPIYRGTTTIKINKENPQIVEFKEIFAVNSGDTDYYQTEYKILESRSLAKRVIQVLKLSEHPEFLVKPETSFQEVKSNALSFLHSFVSSKDKESAENEQETRLINRFLKQLKVEPIRNSRLVKIHFDSKYPDLSAKVSNTVASTYIKQNLESRVTTTEAAKEWLNQQLESLKAKVEKAEEALQDFGSKHDIVSLEEKENVTIQRLSELNEALTKAESDRMAKEGLFRQIKDKNSDSMPSILENKLIQDLKQSFVQVEAQYMRLSEAHKPEYPEMVRLKSQMDTIQGRLNAEVNKIVDSIKNDYESNLRRESLLRKAFEQQKAKAMEMKQKAIQYNILKREADTNRELHKGLLQRMKEVGVSAGITASNVMIVDSAEVPIKPHRPNKPLNLILAAVLGLSLGVGLAVFLEHLDNTVKTPEDLEHLIRLPSFGMVPRISNGTRRSLERGISRPVELITFSDPKSMLSESYRNIRTSILLSFSKKAPKKIAITSPNPGEGKTTTTINTAIALAQTGAQVLIIDSDMRNPRLHRIFDKPNETGLSNFLSGNAELESIVTKTEIPNLSYVLAGPIPPNPSELIGSDLFKQMLESLGERFHHILIDCPPVLGFADSVILSTLVEGVILVALGGSTPRETLTDAKELLLQVNARILGVVINGVDIQRNDYGYYYYRYQYYYGEKGKKGKEKKKLPHFSERESMSA